MCPQLLPFYSKDKRKPAETERFYRYEKHTFEMYCYEYEEYIKEIESEKAKFGYINYRKHLMQLSNGTLSPNDIRLKL